MKKNFKNIIGLFIIISIFLAPFLGIQKAYAQSITASSYIDGLVPVITKLPGCKEAIKNGINDLFGKEIIKGTKKIVTTSEETAEMLAEKASSVQTFDPIVVRMLQNQGFDIIDIREDSASTKKSVGSMDKNDNCLNAIGKAVVKILVQKLTLSIVEWIQTGNSGGPMFVQDPAKFFKDIAKEEILGFGIELQGTNNPFAKNFLINQANKFNYHFAENARYSLNEMIEQTNPDCRDKNDNRVGCAEAFSTDFSAGGWGAWDALTQVPYNNPLGFNIEASNELGKRLQGTIESKAENLRESLQQAGGFLGDYRCSKDISMTQQAKDDALAAGKKDPCEQMGGKWEYTTPGSVVAHTLTESMDDNKKSLISADTLNDAIAAILDAVVARFSSELTNKGLAALSGEEDPSSDTIELGNIFNTTSNTGNGTQFSSSSITEWLRNNPNFNLHTDVTQALVDEQRTYVNRLNSYNIALEDLIKWIRQLDYCIPGPNPDWTETTLAAINNVDGPRVGKRWWDTETGAVANSILDPGGIFTTIGNMYKDEDARKASARYLEDLLEVNVSHNQNQIRDQSGVVGVLNNLFNSYRKWVKEIYFTNGINQLGVNTLDYMPGVTLESRAKFRRIAGYEEIIGQNIEEIIFKKSIISRLQSFKQKIDSGIITPAELDDPSSGAVTEFARLSNYLITGDDIGNIDNLYKQALDEKDYVKNNLVEGPFGCEKEMLDLWHNNKNVYDKYIGRQPYPFEIIRSYDTVESGYGGNSPSYNLPWSPAPVLHYNEGFLFGSVYYNNWAGPWNLPSGMSSECQRRWIHDVSLTATNSKGYPDPDLGGLDPNGDGNGNYQNVCGKVLNFERNFSIY